MTTYPPESDNGNIEYKQQLLNLTPHRFQQLATQMKYRLHQGEGECVYELGIADNGDIIGLSESDMNQSVGNLNLIAKEIGCHVYPVSRTVVGSKFIQELMVREDNSTNYIDLTIGILGSVDASKSTLLGVLTSGELDNGRGKARLSIFNHRHEISTGRTSSATFHIIGFDSSGKLINGKNECIRKRSWPDIISKSKKIVTFLDLPGHDKYLRTAMSGMIGSRPDYAVIMVDGSNQAGITDMTKEHVLLCLILRVPFIVVVSKIDIAPPDLLQHNIENLKKLLKLPGVKKKPFSVNNVNDLSTCLKNIKNNLVPIVKLSCVTGKNIELLILLLNCLQPRTNYSKLTKKPVELSIIECFRVKGIGTVVHGLLTQGRLTVNQDVLVGPDSSGKYQPTKIRGIHCKRVNVREVTAGKHICLNLRIDRNLVKKGMVVLSKDNYPRSIRKFRASVLVLKSHHTTIKKGYEPVIHIGSVKQTAKIVDIEKNKEVLRGGEKSKITLCFKNYPVFITKNSRFFFREGKTRGAGTVLELIS